MGSLKNHSTGAMTFNQDGLFTFSFLTAMNRSLSFSLSATVMTGDRTGDAGLGVTVRVTGAAGAIGDRFSLVTILIFVSDGFEAISYSTLAIGVSLLGWKKSVGLHHLVVVIGYSLLRFHTKE